MVRSSAHPAAMATSGSVGTIPSPCGGMSRIHEVPRRIAISAAAASAMSSTKQGRDRRKLNIGR